ncbi:hypothetical protein HCN44_003875 [Aphidius gifuensis]|uniref:Calpain catalytic domain-containing protein n=1 Tax=Aphidius gifuensis TaxID=684658 RepID=A0A834XY25_APHGI|nr:hypothetical protein HCN44_003875 [Aphidius gifuensis]
MIFQGHCTSAKDESTTSKRLSSQCFCLTTRNHLANEKIQVENVQLTEYKNGEVIELQQQDFIDLQKTLSFDHKLFEDDQFPPQSFLNSPNQVERRPTEISKKPEETVFFVKNKKIFHIKQGCLGDCWFLVALIHLEKFENLFKFIVSPDDQSFDNNYAGIFHFRFWQVGTWVDVVIDDRLPTKNGELVYPSLIEKAYAKLLYRSYEKLNGGYSRLSMQDLSGGVKIISLKNDNKKLKLLRIRNPHGKESSNFLPSEVNNDESIKSKLKILVDGESWILYEYFIILFEYIDICNLTPSSIITDNIYGEDGVTKLSLSTAEGKLMGGMNSKEVNDNDFYAINPQYRMVIKDKGEDKTYSVLIGISLKRRHDSVRLLDTSICFSIFTTLDNTQNLSRPLKYYKNNDEKVYGIDGEIVQYGQASHRLDLDPGTYFIMPYTYDSFKGATFFIQILSEQDNILEDYDRDISMPNINDKEIVEVYENERLPGHIHYQKVNSALRRNGYSISLDTLNWIKSLFGNTNNLIHFNDLMLIVFTLETKTESFCKEFNAKLCQGLIEMVHDNVPKSNHFGETEIHDLRIDIDQFKIIIQFIKELKEQFFEHASTPYRSVSFAKFKNLLDAINYKLTQRVISTIFQTHGNVVDIFYHQFLQSVVDITKTFGHCTSAKDESTTSKRLSSLTTRNHFAKKKIQVENVQLTEYKNGEVIELQQQDFIDLKKTLSFDHKLFEDDQFPPQSFLIPINQTELRPKEISKNSKETVFFVKNKKIFHIKQSDLGDCWFLVALIHLEKFENLFKFIVSPDDQSFDNNYAGIFHFRFWQAGTWVDVVIDDRLPTENGKLVYVSSGYKNEYWPSLIEKAYAKLLYRSYEKLDGGFSRISTQDLSGGISELYFVRPSSNILFETIKKAMERNQFLMISAGSLLEDEMEQIVDSIYNIVPGHYYAITGIQIITLKNDNKQLKLIRIRDPYGEESSNFLPSEINESIKSKLKILVDGESWILYEDFIKYFELIEICNLTPSSIISNNIFGKDGVTKLSLSTAEGKLMGRMILQEVDNDDYFRFNPQYRMVIKDEGKNDSYSVLIGISLKRRHDLERVGRTSICFTIIRTHDNGEDLPRPLKYDDQKLDFIDEYIEGVGQISHRIDLNPGTYFIIPYTYDSFKGATFFLQILSEQDNILENYDRDISMPKINDKFNDLISADIEESDYDLFSSFKFGNGPTIDFKGLHAISRDDKFSLNQNCHVVYKFDDSIIPDLELLSITRKFLRNKRFSISRMTKITLIYQEIFETYEEQSFPGHIYCLVISRALQKDRYFINKNILQTICSLFVNENKFIRFNDFMLIVFTLKTKTGSYCEEFNAKLCQGLIEMVHDNIPKSNDFGKTKIHDLRIDINQFKIIIQFIKELKLTEYKNGEVIELQKQDFVDLQKTFISNNISTKLFEDDQFPPQSFLIPPNQIVLRPMEISKNPEETVYFVKNKKIFHIKQSELGNCWFLVGLIHLEKFENLFKFIVSPDDQSFNNNYAGIFHFRFWQVGTWVDVVIDDRLPTENGQLVYPSLIEKAYAKLLYRSYQKLDWGSSRISMQDLSGGISEFYFVQPSSKTLFDTIQKAIKKNQFSMINCRTWVENEMEQTVVSNYNLVPGHYYAITGVKIISLKNDNKQLRLIRLRNPHGEESSNFLPSKINDDKTIKSKLKVQVDGESWILYEDFIKYFKFIDICNLTPNSIITDHIYSEDGATKLSLSTAEGKLIGGMNSKEVNDNDFYAINPQYRMVIRDEGKDDTYSVLIGISLKRRHDLVYLDDTSICFAIIKTYDNTEDLPRPLKYNDDFHKKLYDIGGEIKGYGQVGRRFDVDPGTYFIIPYILDNFKGATFFLQILSEQDNILEDYEGDISMPNINDKFNALISADIEKSDYVLFSSFKFENDQTIDFKGLHAISRDDKFSLNQNCHFDYKIDDSIIDELKLLSETRKFIRNSPFSISRMRHITSVYQEIFEIYEEQSFPGHIYCLVISRALRKDRYFIKKNILQSICSLFVNENKFIRFNDFMLIVFTLKTKTGSYCEEFNAKLCQGLIEMVHDNIPKSNNFGETEIHDLRIDINQFKIIIQFIKELKEQFFKHASESYRSVSFAKFKNLLGAINYKLTQRLISTIFQTHGNVDDIFYHQFLQSVVDITKTFGHCTSAKDESTTSKMLSSLTTRNHLANKKIEVKNVQLTEYKNGEVIKLEQQDFIDLKKTLSFDHKLFEDDQFPPQSFLNSPNQVERRPTEISKNFKETVFFLKNKKIFHIKQSELGNCWFLVGLIHLEKFENLFKFIVSPDDQSFDTNYAGIFHFRFWQVGTWVDVVIDDRLAFDKIKNKLVYVSSGYENEYWPALIEKAYAKLLYRSYQKLDAGFSRISMQDLSGGISELYAVQSSSKTLFETIKKAIEKNQFSMISCATIDEEKMNKIVGSIYNLDPGHYYAITGIQIITLKNDNKQLKLIRIRNPYGEESSNFLPSKINDDESIKPKLKIQVDGESWILYEDFIKYFDLIEICNLTPSSIITDNIFSEDGATKLSLSTAEGKLMGGMNSKEVDDDDFYAINPQYRMVIRDEGMDDTYSTLIGISLKRRHDSVPVDDTSICFSMITYDDTEDVPRPLKYDEDNEEDTSEGYGQASRRFNLYPGTYFIIPYTNSNFKGATFFLQILSEQDNILEYYDRDISTPNINDKFNSFSSANIETSDYDLFSSKTFGNGQTIDFKGLYAISRNDKFSLNQNCHVVYKFDDSIIPDLELLSITRKFVRNKRFYISRMTKITLIYQEIFESYEDQNFSGHIYCLEISRALEKDGYVISKNILRSTCSLFVNENKLIHFKDFMLIVFTLKTKTGFYCEEFNAKLCQGLIEMVHDNIPKSNHFGETEIHDLRIDINQFKIIIQFIKELKEQFFKHASESYRSVSFVKFKNLLDAINYKLTHRVISTIFQTHGNVVDIFHHQFLQSVVDITKTFGI